MLAWNLYVNKIESSNPILRDMEAVEQVETGWKLLERRKTPGQCGVLEVKGENEAKVSLIEKHKKLGRLRESSSKMLLHTVNHIF